MNEATKREIGRRIKERRIQLNISQEELARLIGYTSNNSRSTINKVELGINDVAQSKLPLYAKALNTTEWYILGLDSEPHPQITDKEKELWDESLDSSVENEVHLFTAVKRILGEDADELLQCFVQLNSEGKAKAIDTLSDLTAIEKYIEKKGE